MNAGSRLPGTPKPMHYWKGAHGNLLAGDAWGNQNDPLVLLLHGGGQTRHAWHRTAGRLAAAGFFAIAYDARGHGDSDWLPDGNYSLDAMAKDLASIISILGKPRPSVIGASIGGATALTAIGEQFIDARALVLVDMAPRTEPEGFTRIRSFTAQGSGGFDSLDEVTEAIARYRSEPQKPNTRQGLAKVIRLGDDGKYRWHWDPRFLTKPEELDSRHQRLSACASSLTVPTLLVRGASSDVVSEAGAAEFLSLCPHAEYVNVRQAGHMLTGDTNDAFGGGVIDFLQNRCT